ncbi:MAG: hypothetical protein QM657_08750, partial [Lacrimispora sp.]
FAFDIFDEALKKTRKTSEFFEILNRRVISYPRNPLFPDLGLHTIIADKLVMHLFWKKEMIQI